MRWQLKWGSILITVAVLFHSCLKEYSCEGCIGNNKPPLAAAGPDTVITLPTDSLLLDGSRSSDPDGKISEWQWTKVEGPASFTIVSATAAITTVRNLKVGAYQFELKVTDDKGASAKDTILITVDSIATSNLPPVACAGADRTITLPTDTVTLDGSCSTDPENNISSYRWTKIAGPASFTIANENAETTQVSTLTEGDYQFELKVTDAGGLFSKDTVQVTVKSSCDVSNRPLLNATLTEIGRLSEPRIPAVGAAGSKIVFAGGKREYICDEWFNSSSAVDIYDINTHGWTTAKLSKERFDISVASIGNKIFFAGGTNWENHGNWHSYSSFDNIDIYDASTNSWSVAHLSKARSDMAVAVVENKVVFAGGFFQIDNPDPNSQHWDISDVVDIYDASTNTWSTAKLSAPRYRINAVVISDKVYFAGGDSPNGTNVNVVDIYNSSTNTWITSNLSDDLALKNSTQISNYVVWSKQNPVQIKNINNGTTISSCVSGNAINTTGLKDNGLIFFTAYDYNNYALTQFNYYNTATGNWSVKKLNQEFPGTAFAGVITVNNTTYLAGGVSGNDGCHYTYHDKVYILSW